MAFSDFVRLLREKGIKETFYLEYLALHQYLGAALAVRACVRIFGVFFLCSSAGRVFAELDIRWQNARWVVSVCCGALNLIHSIIVGLLYMLP